MGSTDVIKATRNSNGWSYAKIVTDLEIYNKFYVDSTTSFVLNIANNTHWKIIISNAAGSRCAEFIAACNSTGNVDILETKKGSNITLTTETNKITVTGNVGSQTYSVLAFVVRGQSSGISIS